MRNYGSINEGELVIEKLSSNPTHAGADDEARIFYNTTEKKVFYGTDSDWALGLSGYSGYSGYSAYSGYSGKSGYSGYSGYSGISGYSAASGFSGFSGYSGVDAQAGYSGPSGYSGYSGLGLSGYSGYSGISGYSGKSGFSGSAGVYAGRAIQVQLFGQVDAVEVSTVNTPTQYISVPLMLDGKSLVRAQARVLVAGSSGDATTVQVRNITKYATHDALSGAISVANTGTLGTVGTINTSYDDVSTDDLLVIYIPTVATGALGLIVILEFA